MWKTKNDLKKEILKYFILFSIVILGILWLFQFVFLNFFYREQKINDIKVVANKMKSAEKSTNFQEITNNLAFDKSVCIEIDDANFDSLYISSYFGKGCISNFETTYQYKFDFLNSKQDEKTYFITHPMFQSETIVYAFKLANNQYAFINASLEPVDDIVFLIRKQLIVISIILIILSYIIAYFIANHISNPIKKINNQAKNLGKENFKTSSLKNNNILEIEELSNTLNYVNQELNKTEELRRDLMANVSHDLKTPLTMIKATAEMSKDLHKENPKKQEEDMDTIISEADRLTILVNDILELSKMETVEEKLKWEEFNLVEMVNNILKKYDVLKETEKYHFTFIHDKDKIKVKADKKKIEQVIYNLINNAIHYTGEDNQITIKISTSNNVLVEIIDTGNGIEEKEIPYIWDKYYKSEKKHKRNLIGTGLGLSIVKNILEQHHFTYGVSSTVGKGSCFYFEMKKED